MGSESFLIAKYEVCEECYSLKGNGSSALLPWYLYSASLPLGCSWVISFDNNSIFFCVTISCAVGRGCLLWLGQSLGKTWLAFDLLHFFFFFFYLLHFVPQGQTCLLLQVSQQICKIKQWSQDGKRSVFIPIPKGNAKECSNYLKIVLISHSRR